MREIGLDHRMAINHRAFRNAGQRHAADAHRDAADRRIATLQDQKIGWKEHAVADLEILGTLDAEAGDLVAGKHKSAQIAGLVETALGYRNQFPGQQTLSWRGETLEALVIGECFEIGWHLDRLAACQQAVATIVKAYDLFDTLDSHVEHAITLADRLGVVPAPRGQRLAIRSEHRRDFGIGYACRSSVAIDNPPAQPRAAIGKRDEMTAVRLDVDARETAECGVVRRQHKAAAEFQIAKARQRGIAIVERSYRRRGDFDARDPCRIARRIGEGERADGNGERNKKKARNERAKT